MAARHLALQSTARHFRLDPLAICAGQLCAWWHADDHGTARMVEDGGGLITWTDRIAGLPLTAGGTVRPSWNATAFYVPGWVRTPRPGVVADGVSGFLEKNSIAGSLIPVGTMPGELWATWTNTGAVAGRYLCGYGLGTHPRVIRQTVGTFGVLGAQGETVTLADRLTLTPLAGVTGLICTGTDVAGRTQGRGFSDTSKPGVTATVTTWFRLFANVSAAPLNFWQGALRQVLVTGLLTRGQRLELEAALAWDAGLSLIYTHPYRWGRP